MKVLVLISLVGGLMLSSCGGSSSKNNANVKEVNPADTIYLGDLREKFANDSVFFKIVAPDLMLMDYQYLNTLYLLTELVKVMPIQHLRQLTLVT